jgi:hypothetical protein
MNKSEAAQALAALRKTETKPCAQCGVVFLGMIRKTLCESCRNKNKTNAYNLRKKENKDES